MKFILSLMLCLQLGCVCRAVDVQLTTLTGVLRGSLESSTNKAVAVLILAGSGPTDRDGNSAGLPGKNNSLKYLAEALKGQGIASLRIDKRGIAASTSAGPKEVDLRFETYIDDAGAWLRFLRKDCGYQRVIILGHSEGSLIGMIAAQREKADGFISIAGAGRKASVVLREQLATKLPPDLLKENERVLVQLEQGKLVDDSPPLLDVLYRRSVQPYLISWFKYDPQVEIAKLTMPVLLVQGSTDIQVSVADAERLHKSKPDAELVIVDGMNHIMKEVKGGLMEQMPSYSDPALPLHKKLVEAVVGFVRKVKG